ncbi:M protein [Helicobacter pylori]|uniref:M protein n=1 Tax=Helicobacter pylori TaxID=210 RepID=UPI00098939DB|nr:M protein [Helicobacter pylori]OOC23413.1 M protein [Helicobacter pylori]
MFGKSSNDTQENPKDAQKSTKPIETTELTNENTKLKTEKTELNSKITGLSAEKDKLDKEKTELTEKNKNLTTEKERLERESKNLTTEKENLNNQLNASQKQVNELKNSKQVLENEKAELERRHAPYQKLEKLYEVFLEVKDRLNFNFVATTHSAMDLIASVLSDSKYYLENLYNQASQELGDKRSDKGEKLAELFDLLFEYVKDSKFERLKEPSAYDYSCKTLYPEQNTSQKMQRVVLRGYKHNDKVYHTIVDMGS